MFLKTNHTSVSLIYSTLLQSGLEEAFLENGNQNKKDYQITGIETHDLFLRFPNITSLAAVAKKQPLYVSRIEYVRRLLYHFNKIVPDCDNVLSYIVYIESLYSELSQTFKEDEVVKSEKRMAALLKKYQKNYSLYIMYAEHVFKKSKQ